MSWLGFGHKNDRRTKKVSPTIRDDGGQEEARQALLRAQTAYQEAASVGSRIQEQGIEVEAVSSRHRDLLAANHFGESIRDSFNLRKG